MNKKRQIRRDEKGRFIYTTGAEKYKRKNVNGKNLLLHRKIWEDHFGKIPQGNVIHHINGIKKDNRIENLKMMSYQKHNQLHAHEPWNKGKKCFNISKSNMGHKVKNSTRLKISMFWINKMRPSMNKINTLHKSGMNYEQIAKELNLTKGQVSSRNQRFTFLLGGKK